MKYQLIACDIDETLYENGKIAKANLEAIRAFQKQGGKFILATGRPAFTLRPLLEELGLWKKPGEYLLANNGALIVSCEDQKVIGKNAMPTQLAKDLFVFGKAYDVCIEVFCEDQLYLYNLNDDERERLGYFGIHDVKEIKSMDEIAGEEIIKMMFQNTDIPYLKEIEKQIPSEWKERLSLSYSSNRYMELNDSSVDKGKALKQLISILGITQEETIAIGDNENDISMVEFAGLGVCVENGQPTLKAVANVITKKDASQGAVAEVIETYCLNQE